MDEEDPFNKPLNPRRPNLSYRGSNPFNDVQWPYAYKERPLAPHDTTRPETQRDPRVKDDPSIEYDIFRQESSEFVFENMASEFPSLASLHLQNRVCLLQLSKA